MKTLLLVATLAMPSAATATEPLNPANYEDLLNLFEDWREFERPPLREGAPDYTAETFTARYAEFAGYRDRLNALDVTSWPIEHQVDWQLVRAEMNGFDFNYRVLRPWARDPAFYQSVWTYKSDVPAHEGPTHHALLELWSYEFPLTPDERERLIQDLAVIPPLLKQAKKNLTGNASGRSAL